MWWATLVNTNNSCTSEYEEVFYVIDIVPYISYQYNRCHSGRLLGATGTDATSVRHYGNWNRPGHFCCIHEVQTWQTNIPRIKLIVTINIANIYWAVTVFEPNSQSCIIRKFGSLHIYVIYTIKLRHAFVLVFTSVLGFFWFYFVFGFVLFWFSTLQRILVVFLEVCG